MITLGKMSLRVNCHLLKLQLLIFSVIGLSHIKFTMRAEVSYSPQLYNISQQKGGCVCKLTKPGMFN